MKPEDRSAGSTGRLVLCPTPLGNLEDVTLRVLRVLHECDVIFAEDTRVTKTLLRHYDISTPLRSFHQKTEASRLRELRALLSEGKTVAMVSDAGMPGISDPGSELVREARDTGAAIEVLPGPSALPAALVLSGFDISSFRFDGFPPRKQGERRTYLATLEREPAAVVWFEAPNRVAALLQDVAEMLGERRIFALREYTKKFEQHLYGTAREVLQQLSDPPRGEFTLVLEGARVGPVAVSADVMRAIELLRERGLGAKDVAQALHSATGLSRNELYRLALKARVD
jgi:16S rRNA (cytidine1402-2'-O)-methyltransferase